MKTNEQRIMLMHIKADQLKKKKVKTQAVFSGLCSTALLVFLIVFMTLADGNLHTIGGFGFSGNSMLSDGAGGYVLVGVVSFVAAVIITLVCLKFKNNEQKNSLNDKLNALATGQSDDNICRIPDDSLENVAAAGEAWVNIQNGKKENENK